MKKPWSVPYLVKKIWPFSGIVARAGLVAAVFVGLFLFPAQAHAARTITSATLNGGSSVTVAPSAAITAAVNVTTDGTGAAARWRSTGWLISTTAPGTVTCVDHLNHDGAGSYSETFSITAPATSGTYNAYFIAYNNDTCSSGASATRTMAGAVIVTVTNPVPTTTSISPASKNEGDGAFTLTVNGSNFVPGSVVNFAGSPRTTTYVSATQLTATIPASDLATVGTFNITVFNPAPGGGTSNAQTFTVTAAFPAATTNAASGMTTENSGASWAATLNGIVSSNGTSSTVSFEYGLDTAYGYSIAAGQSPLAANAVNAAVSADLIGLNCNTLFHYRVKATNSAGTSYGLDGTFTTGSCPSAPFAATDCAATRFGKDLGCTANDVNLTGITVAPGSVSSCVSGTPVTLDIDMTVNFAAPDRWDVGIFIANDGKLPTLLPANGGASSCSVDILPITPPTYGYTFPDLDGAPMGTSDTCGDGNSAINGGSGSGVKRMTGVTLPCYANADSGGKLFVPFVVSWDNQKSPIGGLCTSNQHPVPNTTSKCNAPLSSVAIEVVVLPKIIKTHSGASFNSGDPITYTITVFNDSGGTLQQSTLKDSPGSGLTVTDVSCATSSGSTCPTVTVGDLLAGISIPSANLPNSSSLIFTVTGTLSGGIGQTISNTASITIGSHTNPSTDSVTLGYASGSKSFAPATITEGNNSLMTITFTNPTAFDVTGVSFLDTYPSGLVNAASPNVSTTCGGTVTAIAGGLTFSGGTIPASGSCTVSVYVTSATANNYINSVSFLPGSLGSASATLTVNVAVFGAFNVCDDAPDPNTTCTSTTTVTNSRITTKIAGSAFYLDIVALNTDGTRNTNYKNDVLVELLDASDNGGAPDAYNCRGSWTVIATLSPKFSNPDNGLITVGPFPVPEAYRDVRVRVTNVGGATRIGCSTDNFAIRPATFTLIAQDTDAQTAGTARTLNTVDVSNGPVHKAGRPFTFTATAYNAAGSPAPTINYVNNVGHPSMTLSACSGTACTSSFGTFAPGITSFASGTLSSSVASYSEVGAFNLTLQDTDFASVDAVDTAASCAGYYVCSAATPVGRFVPDHFDTAVVPTAILPMPCPTGLTCPASYDGFVYSGQPFSIKVSARNTSTCSGIEPDVCTTQNYQGAFAKAVTLTAWDAKGGATQNPGSGVLGSNAVASAAFISGVATLTDTPTYTFGTSPTVPTDIYVRAVDTDSVTSLRAIPENSVEGGVKVVSGRVKIGNAYGSELLDLPMSATVQYYDGTNWLTSLTDSVTNLVLSVPTSVSPQCKSGCPWTTTPAPVSGQVIAGVLSFKLSKPAGGGTGSVDVSISAPDYLLTGSNVAAVDPSKPGRATFGVYKGNNQFIYLREMY
ncbi:MAG: isopeptide-forming domain-containing fimbrial protein [Nitrosomonadales bacterium]|nr:isopeptide-forming domain-containing fimbrial protein [Nitrosomonadales bacterium]